MAAVAAMTPICMPLIVPSPRTSTFSSRMTVKPLAVLTSPGNKMKAQYILKERQNRHFHELPSGLKMEVISQKMNKEGEEDDERPPLVFIHGSFHGAWCWAQHWLPFFSHHGFDCHALSLLAQGESDDPPGKVAGTLETYAAGIAHFIKKELTSQPVLLGHSFGGLIVQYYLSSIRNEEIKDLAGAVLVCSVPPSGNSGLVWRYLFSKPIAAFKDQAFFRSYLDIAFLVRQVAYNYNKQGFSSSDDYFLRFFKPMRPVADQLRNIPREKEVPKPKPWPIRWHDDTASLEALPFEMKRIDLDQAYINRVFPSLTTEDADCLNNAIEKKLSSMPTLYGRLEDFMRIPNQGVKFPIQCRAKYWPDFRNKQMKLTKPYSTFSQPKVFHFVNNIAKRFIK